MAITTVDATVDAAATEGDTTADTVDTGDALTTRRCAWTARVTRKASRTGTTGAMVIEKRGCARKGPSRGARALKIRRTGFERLAEDQKDFPGVRLFLLCA